MLPGHSDARRGVTEPADALTVDRLFFDALLAGDGADLEQVLDPQFVIVDVGAGDVTARAEFVAAVTAGAVVFERIDTFPDEALVRKLGECAVIVGRTAMQVTLPDGTSLDVDSRYTHVFTPNPGGWRLASAQGTAITPAVPTRSD